MHELLRQQHSEANENARQVFSSFISWYTFFWTLNMLALAFVYAPPDVAKPASVMQMRQVLTLVVSSLFCVLNVLGILACYFSWKSIAQLREQAVVITDLWIGSLGTVIETQPSAGLFPRPILTFAFLGSGISLVLNLGAWIILPQVIKW